MVGSRFCELAEPDFKLIKADFKGEIPVDITKEESVFDFFKKHGFSWAILFSAFTDVDAAEKQRHDKDNSCWQINVEGTKNVVRACQKTGRNLIFISTDFVFDGTRGPYDEEDITGLPDKLSWYGLTKLEAEEIVRKDLKNYIILRITYPYRGKFAPKDDLAKRILRLYRNQALYPMFTDQITTPTFIDDLAPGLSLLINGNQTGIFHLASPEIATQYDFAKEVVSVFGGDPNEVKKGLLREFARNPNSAPRPVNGGLKVDKIIKAGFKPTNWKEGISKIYEQSQGELL